MVEPITTTISFTALAVSLFTAWLTYGRRGTLRMSQPAVIYFGPDGSRNEKASGPPKIHLRALIFATAKRGRVIESMYVSVQHNEAKRNFHIWVYGDDNLRRGSGIFVGESGLAVSHHFLTSRRDPPFVFSSGEYVVEVYAKLMGEKKPLRLLSQQLHVSETEATDLRESGNGLYFDWGPDTNRYLSHIDSRNSEPEMFAISTDLNKVLGEHIGHGMPAPGSPPPH